MTEPLSLNAFNAARQANAQRLAEHEAGLAQLATPDAWTDVHARPYLPRYRARKSHTSHAIAVLAGAAVTMVWALAVLSGWGGVASIGYAAAAVGVVVWGWT